VRSGRRGVVSVILGAHIFGDAMIDHVGMGKAVGRVLAMTERQALQEA
jgi:hypothetical protein